MKKSVLLIAAIMSTLLLAGCGSTEVKNASGRTLWFADYYAPGDMAGGKYVTIEVNRRTKETTIANISTEKPSAIKPNQEVIVFNKALTRYAIALDDYSGMNIYTNTIPGTWVVGEKTRYFVCNGPKPSKADRYTACSSDLFSAFMPYEIVMTYGKGQMPQFVYDDWKRRTANWLRPINLTDTITRLNIVSILESNATTAQGSKN